MLASCKSLVAQRERLTFPQDTEGRRGVAHPYSLGFRFSSDVSGSSKPRRGHLCVPRRTENPLGDGRCVIHNVPCSNEDTAITKYQYRTKQWATYNGNIQFTCIQNTTITTFLPVPSDCDITLQSLDKNQSDRVLNTSKN